MFRKVSLLTQDDGTLPTGKMYRFIWAIKTDAPKPPELTNASGVFDPVPTGTENPNFDQKSLTVRTLTPLPSFA